MGLHVKTVVSSDCHLEIGHQWSDQHHLDFVQLISHASNIMLKILASRLQ